MTSWGRCHGVARKMHPLGAASVARPPGIIRSTQTRRYRAGRRFGLACGLTIFSETLRFLSRTAEHDPSLHGCTGRNDMGRKHWLLLSTLLLGVATHVEAQTLIGATRRIDWTQAGMPGGIPNRTTICATLNPGATFTQINSAISACNNGVVFLNPGTYNLAGGIVFNNKSNVK